MFLCRSYVTAVALGVAVATFMSCGQNREAPSVAESIDALMTSLVEDGHFVSGAVVVGRDGEILYERGFGFANVADEVPLTPDTPVYGASMEKTVTSTAIMMLVEDGRVRLDSPVTEYIPEFPYPEIRVRHLLEHSSGLLPDGPLLAAAPRGEVHTNKLLLDLLVQNTPPLAFTPGSEFLYSAGLILAAIIVERVTGESYPDFLHHRIFEPLGMESSFVRAPDSDDGRAIRALGYRQEPDGTLERFDVPDIKRVYGIDYSARDLYRWVSSFYERPLLGQSALQSGLESPLLGEGHLSGITLLNWYHADSGRRFYFTGDSHGFYNVSYWDADNRYAFVYTSNTLLPNWLRPRLAIALVDILEGRPPAQVEDPHYAVAGVPTESWNLYAGLPSVDDFSSIFGDYDVEPVGRVSIEYPPENWLNVGWMMPDGWFTPVVRLNGGLRLNMFPVEPGLFYIPCLDAWVGFTERDGKPTLHWTQVHAGTSMGTRVNAR